MKWVVACLEGFLEVPPLVFVSISVDSEGVGGFHIYPLHDRVFRGF